MITATNFDFVNARLHGLRSRLFEGERLADLVGRHTLPEVAQAAIGEPMVASADAIERRLVGDHVADLAGLSAHLRGAECLFFRSLLERYRTENLKVIVRWRAAREPRTSPAPLLVPLPDWLEVSYERLIATPDLAGLVAALPAPRLVRAAEAGLDAFEQTGSTFFVEAALDRATFVHVAACCRRLARRHRGATGGILGRERDLYNVMFVARAAQAYDLPMEDLEGFLAPRGGHVTRALLAVIHAAADPTAILAALPTWLTGRRAAPEDVQGLPDIERLLWAELARSANRLFYDSVFDLGKAVAFFYLKRVELFNVIRVVEGMRYGLSAGAIRERLILTKA